MSATLCCQLCSSYVICGDHWSYAARPASANLVANLVAVYALAPNPRSTTTCHGLINADHLRIHCVGAVTKGDELSRTGLDGTRTIVEPSAEQLKNMNRYAPPSKATATTLCQKCLQRGHYSYECTAGVQSRPYKSRPSRTQQLFNPSLRPALSSDVPNDLLRKKGVADEELARLADERGRKRQRIDDDGRSPSRSPSSSASSVSTISTGKSKSASPPPPKHHSSRPRRRSKARSPSPMDRSSDDDRKRSHLQQDDADARRLKRRRRSSHSPNIRGRTKSRERDRSWDKYRASRQRHRDRSASLDRSRIAKGRRTGSPDGDSREPRQNRDRYKHAGANAHLREDEDDARGAYGKPPDRSYPKGPPGAPPLRKERSLSPYSKRLALTQSMNM